jgi:hypothetical protein
MRLGELIDNGTLPFPSWVKNSYEIIAPELGVMAWKPAGRRGSDPLKSALTWTGKLSGQSIRYAVPESAARQGIPTAGKLTEIVLAGAHGDRVGKLISEEEMPDRDQYPAAIQLRRFFRFKEPLPIMREVWPDALRRAVMIQRSRSGAKPALAAAAH